MRSTPEFKAPAPVAAASGDLILPAYKSLGAVYQKDSSPPQGERERKKKMSNGGMTVPGSGTAKTRSSQHLAERSFSVTETNSRGQGGTTGHNLSSSSQSRTPHRTAGYGGAGQPNRGPHRSHHFLLIFRCHFLMDSVSMMITFATKQSNVASCSLDNLRLKHLETHTKWRRPMNFR